MSTIEEIEKAVAGLPQDKLAEFREWFAHFDAAEWDREFAEDVAAGRLDALAERAIRDMREGRATEL